MLIISCQLLPYIPAFQSQTQAFSVHFYSCLRYWQSVIDKTLRYWQSIKIRDGNKPPKQQLWFMKIDVPVRQFMGLFFRQYLKIAAFEKKFWLPPHTPWPPCPLPAVPVVFLPMPSWGCPPLCWCQPRMRGRCLRRGTWSGAGHCKTTKHTIFFGLPGLQEVIPHHHHQCGGRESLFGA